MQQKYYPCFTIAFLALLLVGLIMNGLQNVWAAESEESHPWDVNGDGVVDHADLVYVSEYFGSKSKTPADVNGDGIVDIIDLVLIVIHLGEDYRAKTGSVVFDNLIDYSRSMQYPRGCIEGRAEIIRRTQPVYELWDYRPVPADVYYPLDADGQPKKNNGVIFVSHGGGADRKDYLYLVKKFVENGFVVIVPEHYSSDKKLLNCLRDGGMNPLLALGSMANDPYFRMNRAPDISFLINEAEKWNRDTGNPLYGTMDLSKIGVTGHSAGAFTCESVAGARVNTYNVAKEKITEDDFYNYQDKRVKAVAPISPIGETIFYVKGTLNPFDTVDIPVFAVIGENDKTALTPLEQRFMLFENLPDTGPKKYQVLLEDSSHTDFAEGGADETIKIASQDTKRIASELIFRFFDYYLNGNPESGSKLNIEYARSLCSPLPDVGLSPNRKVNDILSWKEKGH